MRVKIFQINADRDTQRLAFQNYKYTLEDLKSDTINASLYDEVFNEELADNMLLEDIYFKFNTEQHPLFRGHSLSVSDVISVNGTAFFCDSIGFQKIDFDESQTQKPSDLYKIVFVEPNKQAYVSEVKDDYRLFLKAVDGDLYERVFDVSEGENTVIICNENAKLEGQAGNRRYNNGNNVIAGNFFVIGLDENGNYRSLTDEEINLNMQRFEQPEEITQDEVENDMGITFISF